MGWSAVCDCGFPDHTHLLLDPKHNNTSKILLLIISAISQCSDEPMHEGLDGGGSGIHYSLKI